MRKILEKVTREWERALFAVVLTALLAYLLALILGFGEDRLPSIGGEPPRDDAPLLNPATAWTFLDPDERLTMEFNPFAFEPKRPRHDPPPFTVWAEPVRPPVDPVRPPVQPPVEPPRREVVVLKYQGIIKMNTPIALIKNTGKGTVASLKAGDTFAGFRVLSFDDDFLEILSPAGEKGTIACGEEREFEIPAP